MRRRMYLGYAAALLTLYSAATVRGWELWPARHDKIPQSVRQAPGGYRSFAYWRGGK